ncbi:sigma-70 family RNA polymerase sigma factor [Christensenellaceae bacterium OttesenSCG-928-L17]|nr:sigma-70 family RNA polymerase sigma factor [Christensenellaceae bacterium OttesenSCG-928-L17]
MTNEQLVNRIKDGEIGLMEALIEQNKGILYRIVSRYKAAAQKNVALDMEDLMQSATVGLIEAIPAWDEARGNFLTLAFYYISGEIRREIGIHTTRKRIENMVTVPLSSPIGEDGDTLLVEMIADIDAIEPADSACDMDLCRIIRAEVKRLPGLQREAVEGCFLKGEQLSTISERRGVSLEAVRQQKARGLRNLSKNLQIRRLWTEYESAPFTRKTYAGWKHTHTSAVEQAAMIREWVAQKLAGIV